MCVCASKNEHVKPLCSLYYCPPSTGACLEPNILCKSDGREGANQRGNLPDMANICYIGNPLEMSVCSMGLGSIDSISTWFGIWASILLRYSGPKARAGPRLLLRKRFGLITFRFRSEPRPPLAIDLKPSLVGWREVFGRWKDAFQRRRVRSRADRFVPVRIFREFGGMRAHCLTLQRAKAQSRTSQSF